LFLQYDLFYNWIAPGITHVNGAAVEQTSTTLPLFLTIPQAAQALTISPMLLRQYIWAKKGPRVRKIGGRRIIHRDDLVKWTGKDHPTLRTKKG